MTQITHIKPPSKLSFLNLKEIYAYRELLFTFSIRDLKIRYKQTFIGSLWAIIQPFMTMIVFSFFFGKIAQMPSDGVPYPIFSYSGLLLWIFFTSCLTSSSNSMVGNANLISKIYFPRIILPTAVTIPHFLDYLIASSVLLIMMIWYQQPLTWLILLTPIIVFFTWILAVGIGLWLSAINVKYRDVRHAIPFFISLLIFITPVIYPTSVSGQFKWIVMLNPMSGFIEAHRILILGHQAINLPMLALSIGMTIIIFVSGVFFFKSVERYFADII